jgi:hypothetical protein
LSIGESTPSTASSPVRTWRALDVVGTTAVISIRIAIALAGLYGATILYGIVAGYALPTAAVFHLVPRPGFITRAEDYLPSMLLLLALVGASTGWITYWRVVNPDPTYRNQIVSLRLLQRWGALLLFAATVLALSGRWSGLVLGRDFTYGSLGGLVPHSDAAGYFVSPAEQAITGTWNYFSSRRPLAASFRELTMGLAGLSYVWTLLVQAALVSAAFYAAARSIAVWRGLWCALAFAAFAYVLVPPFMTTTLTEPLGLFWGLLSVMFFVESMRAASDSTSSVNFAFLALVTVTLGEMTRMGSLFTVPAFALWISLAFSSTILGRLKLLSIGSALVLLTFGVQTLLGILYGSSSTVVGGNFAFVLCGLTVGGDWMSCPQIYAAELSRLTTEREQVAFLYSRAFEIAAQDPFPMLSQMYRNVLNLIINLPSFMIFGYLRANSFLPWWPFVLLVPGLAWTLRYPAGRRELLFWTLILGSMILSASIVFADDGWRVFYATWPFVALFFALGFSSPGFQHPPAQSVNQVSVRAGTVLVAIFVGLLVVAPAATRTLYGRSLSALATNAQSQPQEAILAGRTLTGFAVIADSVPFPKNIPAMHVSDFRRVVDNVGLEKDFGKFVDIAAEHVPFAFVTAARITTPVSQPEQLYIAPVQILDEPLATAWRVTLGPNIPLDYIHEISGYRRLQ